MSVTCDRLLMFWKDRRLALAWELRKKNVAGANAFPILVCALERVVRPRHWTLENCLGLDGEWRMLRSVHGPPQTGPDAEFSRASQHSKHIIFSTLARAVQNVLCICEEMVFISLHSGVATVW